MDGAKKALRPEKILATKNFGETTGYRGHYVSKKDKILQNFLFATFIFHYRAIRTKNRTGKWKIRRQS